jgi:hypothetical protein
MTSSHGFRERVAKPSQLPNATSSPCAAVNVRLADDSSGTSSISLRTTTDVYGIVE